LDDRLRWRSCVLEVGYGMVVPRLRREDGAVRRHYMFARDPAARGALSFLDNSLSRLRALGRPAETAFRYSSDNCAVCWTENTAIASGELHVVWHHQRFWDELALRITAATKSV